MRKIERIIINLQPVAFIIKKGKEIKPPGFSGLAIYDVIMFLFTHLNKVGLNERAAAISFNFIMAIPAACIFIFTLVPYIPIAKHFNAELLKLTADITPNQNTYYFIKDFLNDFFNKPRTGLLSFGFLLVIFYASNAMMGIIRAFDKSVKLQKQYFFQLRIRAIKLTTLLVLLVIATILVLIGHEQLAALIKSIFKTKSKLTWWGSVRWIIILALVFYSIALIYKYAPSINKRWKLITPGSLLATCLILITTILFSFWVNNFSSYNKIYGSIGTVLIIMILIYINSLILLIGFELNVSIMQLKLNAEAREKNEQLQSKPS
ncbi:MAG TPA: YihY/virulence factor BrkB family protein [Chitinophagaceae bacterium]|nr:YihY/virulence factor BrkB family protein [Chitinophagaceae bacterium]MCC6635776.1 YihY/virulence factor BrkB family protein [Chitinophagaceae bacterium]HMZ46491.1 YihY/virulence factor BrkB family protein [Chitinophagaceae bacterium]HNE93516.1 YihY/virulence factor BrkB family protein [Chitinophagaceae bacterium]HNF29087.1 YihY/virulence factor BrkB family protein [Chitinophagaceae bacterium]